MSASHVCTYIPHINSIYLLRLVWYYFTKKQLYLEYMPGPEAFLIFSVWGARGVCVISPDSQ